MEVSGATKFSWATSGKYLHSNVASVVSFSFFLEVPMWPWKNCFTPFDDSCSLIRLVLALALIFGTSTAQSLWIKLKLSSCINFSFTLQFLLNIG